MDGAVRPPPPSLRLSARDSELLFAIATAPRTQPQTPPDTDLLRGGAPDISVAFPACGHRLCTGLLVCFFLLEVELPFAESLRAFFSSCPWRHMEKMARPLPLNPAFLPPTHGVLKSLLENPLKLPFHHDEGTSFTRLLRTSPILNRAFIPCYVPSVNTERHNTALKLPSEWPTFIFNSGSVYL